MVDGRWPRQREHRADDGAPALPCRAQPARGITSIRQINGLLTPGEIAAWRAVDTASGLGLQRTAVPGGAARHRDAVPAPGIRGVRPLDSAADQPVPGRLSRPSTRRSRRSSRTRCIASATRCCPSAWHASMPTERTTAQDCSTCSCPSEVQRERTRREQLDGR